MVVEYKALIDNHTCSLVPLPPHRRAIVCKWVFHIKENRDGNVNKLKAHLVARVFTNLLALISDRPSPQSSSQLPFELS